MRQRLMLILLCALALVSSLSCGVAGLAPAPVSMPAARAGLPPQERFFYDALADDGEWILIEPYGFVFRPHVNFVAWRPYQNGFWVPSDVYGWTWISAESFGWATDHYGRWVYDSFEGWVWVPGLDWGPAWVAWSGDQNVVGWAPVPPSGGNWNGVPGGPFLYVPMSQLSATDLSSHMMKAADLGAEAAHVAPIRIVGEHEGLKFNRGPSFEDVERAVGRPLATVKLGEHNPLAPAGKSHAAAAPGTTPPASKEDSVAVVREAAAAEARQAREIIDAHQDAPAALPILRVTRPQPERGRGHGAAPPAAPAPAAPDSAR
jgi:hypothetical protein